VTTSHLHLLRRGKSREELATQETAAQLLLHVHIICGRESPVKMQEKLYAASPTQALLVFCLSLAGRFHDLAKGGTLRKIWRFADCQR